MDQGQQGPPHQGGGGSGDMLKSTYDTGDNGIVDKAETVDDGAGNVKTAAQIKTHIDDTTGNPHDIDADDIPAILRSGDDSSSSGSGITVQDAIDELDEKFKE